MIITAIISATVGAIVAWLWSGAVHAAEMRRKQAEWTAGMAASFKHIEVYRRLLQSRENGKAKHEGAA